MPSAIHIALTIPELRSLDALTSRFRVSSERVLKALNTLLALGLAEKKGTLYFPLSKTLHAGRGSATLRQHHSNWRLNAVESLARESAEELHYTSVVSLARDDVVRIRETLVRAIEDVRNVVKPSQEEDLYCYTLDLFRVE
jgi:DNA-binding GntR family transcriptional regulator